MQTIVFILVIAALVQMVEIMLKKVSPALYQALGIFLPLITTNCAVLGVAILLVQKEYNLGEAVVYAVAVAVGFTLALVLFAGLRERLELENVPKALRGVPIALITAGILADGLYGIFRIGALTRRSKKESVTIHNMEITGGAAKSRPVLYRFSSILR